MRKRKRAIQSVQGGKKKGRGEGMSTNLSEKNRERGYGGRGDRSPYHRGKEERKRKPFFLIGGRKEKQKRKREIYFPS